jgi:hypothetical protein
MRPERWLYTVPLRLRSLFGRARADEELHKELQDHIGRFSTWVASSRRKSSAATPAAFP